MFSLQQKKSTWVKIKAKSEPNGYLDLLFLFYVVVLILKNDRRATITAIMLLGHASPHLVHLTPAKTSIENSVGFYGVLVKRHG